MRKFITTIFRMFFLVFAVVFGFYVARSYQENKGNIKPKLAKIKRRISQRISEVNNIGSPEIYLENDVFEQEDEQDEDEDGDEDGDDEKTRIDSQEEISPTVQEMTMAYKIGTTNSKISPDSGELLVEETEYAKPVVRVAVVKKPVVKEQVVVKQPVAVSQKTAVPAQPAGLNPRQNRILKVLQVKKTVEMKDLLDAISGVTERTLRRDLLRMNELNLVKKEGTTKSVKYHLLSE
jgi:hypothetical protein